jgi:MFS family permease
MLSKFRNIIIMSSGYSIAICSTMIMFTLLPILYSDIRWATNAWLIIMAMTFLQIFVFGPFAANLVDRYGSRMMLFVYASLFIMWALIWLWSYMTDNTILIKILSVMMTISFAAGYGARFVDVYTLRMSPSSQSGMAFGWLVTFAWLGRFLGTLIQPHLIEPWHQIRAPIIMIAAMIIFMIVLWFIKDDAKSILHKTTSQNMTHSTRTPWLQSHSYHIQQSVISLLSSYKNTFSHGWIFIKRCDKFPLIPLSIAFWEGIFFGSLWFIIPLYMSHHPEYISYGFEIGIYELISLICAIWFWYVADRCDSVKMAFLWRSGILIGIILIYFYPSIEILVPVGVLIWLSNWLLYATGQHILSEHDTDHEDDGAYGQTRSIIMNLWFMSMPVIRWLLQFMSFAYILQLLSSILSVVVMMWVIITFYVLIMKSHTIIRR